MYGKMQEFGCTETIPFIHISVVWGWHNAFFHTLLTPILPPPHTHLECCDILIYWYGRKYSIFQCCFNEIVYLMQFNLVVFNQGQFGL